VRRIVQVKAWQRIFPLHSPKIAKSKVKRNRTASAGAKLYYLRRTAWVNATRLRERPRQRKPTARQPASGRPRGKVP